MANYYKSCASTMPQLLKELDRLKSLSHSNKTHPVINKLLLISRLVINVSEPGLGSHIDHIN